MAKCSNLSNRHACEPKIVSELFFPLHAVNRKMYHFEINLLNRHACEPKIVSDSLFPVSDVNKI